jgi:hypothetical protein
VEARRRWIVFDTVFAAFFSRITGIPDSGYKIEEDFAPRLHLIA